MTFQSMRAFWENLKASVTILEWQLNLSSLSEEERKSRQGAY